MHYWNFSRPNGFQVMDQNSLNVVWSIRKKDIFRLTAKDSTRKPP